MTSQLSVGTIRPAGAIRSGNAGEKKSKTRKADLICAIIADEA
jgi:hypothetical protein